MSAPLSLAGNADHRIAISNQRLRTRTIYADPRRDEWQTKLLPALRKIPPPILVKMSGLSPTTIKDTLAGRSRPYPKNRDRLVSILRNLRLV